MANQALKVEAASDEEPKREMPLWVQQLHEVCEIASFIFLIAGGIVAVAEYVAHNHEAADNARKERVEAADKAYSEIDARFAEFLKMCVQYPGLDCYSTPADPAVEPPDIPRQRIAYSMLTDVFEVAFTRYHNGVYKEALADYARQQWPGWLAYMRKFLGRPNYRQVWEQIRDEYDGTFASCMKALVETKDPMPPVCDVK